MTALDLSALEALEREATRAPWAADAHRDAYILADGPPGTVHAMTNVVARVTLTRDVPLIIALRNSFPALAAELRAAREAVESVVRLQTEWLEEGRERNGPQSSWSHGCDLYEIIAKFDRAIEIAGGARSSLKDGS